MKSVLKRTGARFSIVVLFALCAAAQQSAETAKKLDSGYVLGPDDQIVIHAIDAPEISDKPFLIGMNGNVTLPLIGRV
jgi:protein involved in polysaccharide export with SLBB domain